MQDDVPMETDDQPDSEMDSPSTDQSDTLTGNTWSFLTYKDQQRKLYPKKILVYQRLEILKAFVTNMAWQQVLGAP